MKNIYWVDELNDQVYQVEPSEVVSISWVKLADGYEPLQQNGKLNRLAKIELTSDGKYETNTSDDDYIYVFEEEQDHSIPPQQFNNSKTLSQLFKLKTPK